MEASERKRKEKSELLKSLGVKEYFQEGSISIDMSICRGFECKLCIEACPTNALYWAMGEVKVNEDLCIYCTACVTNCIVDNCIRVSRKRPDGRVESYGTPREALQLLMDMGSDKRRDVVHRLGGWRRRFS